MNARDVVLLLTADSVLETLPPVWDRLRSNLRAAATSKFGISLEQFHTLRHIKQGYQSVKDLAAKRQVSPPAISQAVDILVRKGLVTRSHEGEDRRRVLLELTPYAREVMDANYEENRIWARERMSTLSPTDLDEVRKAMAILRRVFAPESSEARRG